jgi:hypothetical protein
MASRNHFAGSFIALATLFLCQSVLAQTMIVTGGGDVIFNNGYTGSLTGSTFTFEIVVDLAEPLGTSGGNNLSSWLQAVDSFTVDSETFTFPSGLFTFQRPNTYDLALMISKDVDSSGAEFAGQLPLNYLGSGPYAMTDFTTINLVDYLYTPKVRVDDKTAGTFGLGEVTSISTQIIPVPEPSTALLLGLITLATALRNRRG